MTQEITHQPIKLIAIDLDGTLLNSQHEMTPGVEKALKAAVDKGVHIILATGKTFNSGEQFVKRLDGIIQVYTYKAQSVIPPMAVFAASNTLDPGVARQVITFAEDRGYTGGRIYWRRILVRKMNNASKN